MKIFKIFSIAAGIGFSFIGNSIAKIYDAPQISTSANSATMGLSGNIQLGISSAPIGTRTVYITLSGANGITNVFGIVTNTMTTVGLLTGTSGFFSSWVQFASSAEVKGLLGGANLLLSSWGTFNSSAEVKGLLGAPNALFSGWVSVSSIQASVLLSAPSAYFNSVLSTFTGNGNLLDISSNPAILALAIDSITILNQESPDISNRTYFLHDESTGSPSVFRLLSSSPSALGETTRTANITIAQNIVMISSFITPTGDPGVKKIPAGVWSYTLWGSADNIANGAKFVATVSTCAYDGTLLTEIQSSTSTNILDLNSQRVDMISIQTADIVVSTGDRLVFKVFGRSTSVIGLNMSLYYAGLTRFSHINTPISQSQQLQDAFNAFAATSSALAAAPISIYSGGTFQGQANTLNFTTQNSATCAGSTCTVVGAASAAGSGGPRFSDAVVIGTRATANVDATIGSQADWITVLSSFGMAGLTTSATAQGRIFLRNGTYVNWITSNPAGSTVMCESSAVIKTDPLGGRSIFNYGTLGTTEWPCTIDGGGMAFTSTVTAFFTNSKANVKLTGFQNQTAGFGSRSFVIVNATGIVATVELPNSSFTSPGSVAYTNDRVPVLVRSSTECTLSFKTGDSTIFGAGNPGVFSFEDVWGSNITFNAHQLGSYYALFSGVGYNIINVNGIIQTGINEQNPNGFIVFDSLPAGSPATGASTNTVVNFNIQSFSTSNGILAKVVTGGSIGFTGTVTGRGAPGANTETVVNFTAGAKNCFTNDLYLFNMGTGVSDSGTNDTLNFWVNGKHPNNQ